MFSQYQLRARNDVLGPLLLSVPPRIGSHKPKDLAA
jgi:hypothetical protein